MRKRPSNEPVYCGACLTKLKSPTWCHGCDSDLVEGGEYLDPSKLKAAKNNRIATVRQNLAKALSQIKDLERENVQLRLQLDNLSYFVGYEEWRSIYGNTYDKRIDDASEAEGEGVDVPGSSEVPKDA